MQMIQLRNPRAFSVPVFYLALLLLAVATVLLLTPASLKAATAEQIDLDFDGEPDRVEVETDFFRGQADLLRNGMWTGLVYKPTNTELSGSQYFIRYYRPGNDWVVPHDPEVGYHCAYDKDAARPTMTSTIERPDENTVRVITEGYCTDLFEVPWYGDLFTRRVITFRDDRRTIEFSYTVTNDNDKPRAVYMEQDHGIDCRFQDGAAYVPQPHGISMRDNSSPGSTFMYVGRLQADWWGVLKATGTGAVETFDGAWVERAVVHAKQNAGLGLRVDMRPSVLKPGESQTWNYTLTALNGLNSLHGTANGLVAGLEFREEAEPGQWQPHEVKPNTSLPIRLRLVSDESRNVSVTLRHFDANGDIQKIVKTLKLTAHDVAVADFGKIALADQLNVFHATVHDGDQELLVAYDSFDASGKGQRWQPDNLNPRPIQGDEVTWAKSSDNKRSYPKPDLETKTEHVPWARPHVDGKAKLLVAIPFNHAESHLREFYQRGDYEIIHSRNGENFENLLAECDIAFIAGINIQRGKQGAQRHEAILKAVREGKGVVIAGSATQTTVHVTAKFLLDAFIEEGTEVTPAFLTKPYGRSATGMNGARCFTVGRGRAVVIPQSIVPKTRDSLYTVVRQLPPRYYNGKHVPVPHDGLYRGFEYVYQSLVHLMDWSAARDAGIETGAMAIEGEIAKRELNASFHNTGDHSIKGTLEVTVRNLVNTVVAGGQTQLSISPQEKANVAVALGNVPSGDHAIEWRLLDGENKCIAFGSRVVNCSGPKLELTFANEFAAWDEGQTVEATVVVSDHENGSRILCQAVDTYGRLVWQDTLTPDAAGSAKVVIGPIPNRSELHDLHVTLFNGDTTLAQRVGTFFLYRRTNPMKDDFYVVSWGPLDTQMVNHRQIAARSARLAGIGYTHITDVGERARDLVYRTNGRPYYLMTKMLSFKRKRDKKTGALSPPFAIAPDQLSELKTKWQKFVVELHEYSNVLYFGLDDERTMRWDPSPGSVSEFRRWLKEKYKSVDALNESWQSNYNSWEQVTGDEEVARYGPEANLAPEVDRKSFISWIWGHRYMRLPGHWTQEVVPEATAGEAGTYGFRYDPLHALGPWFTHTNYYPNSGYIADAYRSVTEPDFEAGPYTGYGMNYDAKGLSPYQRSMPWVTLLNGGGHVSYYQMQNETGSHYGVLQTDGLPQIGFQELKEQEWPDLMGGVGKLILDRHHIESGVGVLHKPKYDAQTKMVIEDLQRQPHIYMPSEVEADVLQKEGVRVLFMDAMRATSDWLEKSIEQFTKQGGHIVFIVSQHYRPGELDENGHRRSNPTFFDRLAGVDFSQIRRFNGRGVAVPQAGAPSGVHNGLLRPTAAGLTTTSAEPIAYVKVRDKNLLAWSRHQYGKGQVHVLNLTLLDYKAGKSGGVAGETFVSRSGPEQMRRAVQAIYKMILDDAQTSPYFNVAYTATDVPTSESFRFETPGEEDGPVVFGFIPFTSGDAQVQFPEAAHIYDVRKRRYVGQTDRFNQNFEDGHAVVWSAMPYKVQSVQVVPSATVVQPGEVLEVDVQVKSTDGKDCQFAHTFAFGIEQQTTNGWVELQAHKATHTGSKARLNRIIPIALNAKDGSYRVVVRDILSGVEGIAIFSVQR